MSTSYAAILRAAAKARWDLDEVTASVDQLDFARPFLPRSLVHAERLPFLDAGQRLLLNQIRAHAYLQFFALAEKFIIPFVMGEAGHRLHRDTEQLLALLQFGEEEAKHIALFERFSVAFETGFGSSCEFVGPGSELAARVLAHDTLAVGLTVLHIEWMTQEHYVRSARGDEDIDPQFRKLLHSHWLEEAQHARLDTLLLTEIVGRMSPYQQRHGVASYLTIVEMLSELLARQVELDIAAFERVASPLDDAQRALWRSEQHGSYRETFLHQGMSHPRLLEFVSTHLPNHEAAVREAAAGLSLARAAQA